MAKLMKHELKANSRIMLPVFLLTALLSVLGGLSARFLNSGHDSVLLKIVFGMFIAIFAISIALLALLCVIYMVQRFYETMAGREAYFTLNLSQLSCIRTGLVCNTLFCKLKTFIKENKKPRAVSRKLRKNSHRGFLFVVKSFCEKT